MTDGFKPIGEAISDLMAKIREPEEVRVIPHPTKRGHWTVCINGSIYGAFDTRAVAVAHALTY